MYPDKKVEVGDLNKRLADLFKEYMAIHLDVSRKEYEEMGSYESLGPDAMCGFMINTLNTVMHVIYKEKAKKKIFRRQIYNSFMRLMSHKGKIVIEGI